jgi:hypothetical protein
MKLTDHIRILKVEIKNQAFKIRLCFIALILLSMNLKATTIVSAASGNWNNASTWSPAQVPTCGDSVIIQSLHFISITNQQNYTGCSEPLKIIVYGTLMFYNGSKLSLPCNSYVIIYPGGIIDHDQGLASSNLINICGIVEWNSNSTLNGLDCLPRSHPICNIILAVEMASFTAEACRQNNEDGVCLNWETKTELNTDYFSVERSEDGENWIVSGKKNAAGNSSVSLNYDYFDSSPISGISYYRLRIFDLNGEQTVSRTITIDKNDQTDFDLMVYPNPVATSITLTMKDNTANYVRMELCDLTGKLLMSKEFIDSNANYRLDGLDGLASGVVLLNIYDKANGLFGTKLIVIE